MINWDILTPIILAILGSNALFAFFQFLLTRKDNKDDRYKELNNKIEAELKEHKKNIQSMQDAIIQLTENDSKQTECMEAMRQSLLGLSYDRIIRLTDRYQMRGAITLREKNSLKAIYEPYHQGLGGNGEGTTNFEFAMDLPVVTDLQAKELDKEINKQLYKGYI